MENNPNRWQPRVVTWDELVRVLLPKIQGYPWAMDTIGDLWRMGAPDPQTIVGTPGERRVLLPQRFQAWWQDVQQRMGHEQGAPAMWERLG